MIKIYYTLFLLSVCNGLYAMNNNKENADIKLIQLPSQQEIARRLHRLGLTEFIEKTKIDHTLGNQMENTYSTDLAVACAMYMYEDAPSAKPFHVNIAKSKKTEVVDAILQDHPSSLEAFKAAVASIKTKK